MTSAKFAHPPHRQNHPPILFLMIAFLNNNIKIVAVNIRILALSIIIRLSFCSFLCLYMNYTQLFFNSCFAIRFKTRHETNSFPFVVTSEKKTITITFRSFAINTRCVLYTIEFLEISNCYDNQNTRISYIHFIG